MDLGVDGMSLLCAQQGTFMVENRYDIEIKENLFSLASGKFSRPFRRDEVSYAEAEMDHQARV